MAPDTSPRPPDFLCATLLERLQYVVLEHIGGTQFRVLGHPSNWLFRLYPEAESGLQLSVDTRIPVLHNFLADAAEVWKTGDARIGRSGFWTEQTAFDVPWHFEALALREGTSRLLVIQHSTTAYEQQASMLQRAREQALQQHEHERGYQRTRQDLTTQLVDMERSRDDVAAILQELGLATLLIDQDGQVRFVSASAASLLELPSPSVTPELQWDHVLLLTKADRLTVQSLLEQPIAPRERVRCHIDTPAGRRLWLELELHDDPRDRRNKIVFLHDMTDVYHLRRLLELKAHYHDLIGKSRGMTHVYEHIQDLARVDSTVLIEGETGTGKELVARALHQASARRTGPFIAANCAGLTDSLLGSQLFGHKKGAFTGAIDDQQGLFEAAQGGVLFLDEIGDIPHTVQTNLLRVLQEKEVTRLGETKPRKIDVRVLTATHHNLSQDVAKGIFRADLLYRIRVARIHLPPLRERKEDIPLLVTSFLAEGRASMGKTIHRASPAAMAALMDYHWPGNVRELKSTIECAMIHCKGDTLEATDLPPELRRDPADLTPEPLIQSDERSRFVSALGQARGNRTKAARLLGMSRATFYRRLTELDLPTS
ncbi:MAG: Sigma-54 factor interaction domain-containing protein [Nitrospira sp.]|nr:sigma 54-interacting transcriptional regulator [Nitrospira sp.]ULA59593.1 MAG: Sigma-54 factor interaction domain-containing protein [Nitrospira sp.]